MKDYKKLLVQKVKEGGYVNPRSIPSIAQPLFETVGVMIDDHGPVCTMNIGQVLLPAFRIKSNGLPERVYELSSKLIKLKDSVGKPMGINSIILGDAIKGVHGKYDDLKLIVHGRHDTSVRSDMWVLYKSEKSLEKYVKDHTKKTKLVVIETSFSRKLMPE